METNKDIFKVGDKVFHYLYKWGTVTNDCKIRNSGDFYVEVKFDNRSQNYFQNFKDAFLLSFTEYTLEGFSQERPEPLPKPGDIVWVRNTNYDNWSITYFRGISISYDGYGCSSKNSSDSSQIKYWKYLTTENPYEDAIPKS
jgi:hypothetical protein